MFGGGRNDERRRERRCDVVSRQSIDLQVERTGDGRPETVHGQLVDLSQAGAKVAISTPLKFSEEVRIRLRIPTLELNMDIHSKVMWVRRKSELEWVAGCSFMSKLCDDVIEQLAEAGIIERRTHPRHPIKIQGRARWELENETFPIEITDYSVGGFCIAADRPGKVGTTVLVQVASSTADSPKSIFGRVCWHVEHNDRHVIGCNLTSSQGHELLRELSKVSSKALEEGMTLSNPGHRAGFRESSGTVA